jgi:hypothetical protein
MTGIVQVCSGRSRMVYLVIAAAVMLCSSRADGQDVVNGPLPTPWIYADVGSTGMRGSATHSYSFNTSDVFTVNAAGADVWGTADSFGYVYQPFIGDGWVSVNVLSLQNTNAFAKIGLMLRETLDPGAPHVILDLRPTGDVEFMTRPTAGAATAFIAGASAAMPAWIELFRDGSTVTAYLFNDQAQKPVALGSTTITMGPNLLVGLAVTSHDMNRTTTATAHPPFVHNYAFGTFPNPQSGPLWNDRDIGPVGQAGTTTYHNGTYRVSGAGADMWGNADAFHFVSRTVLGDAQIVAHVTSVQNTNPFAKAGIDMRLGRGGSAGDSHVILDVRPTGDIEFMSRSNFNTPTAYLGGTVHQAPVWLKLARSGSTISGYVSDDGLAWTLVGSAQPDFNEMNAGDGWVTGGLIVSSHDAATLNTSTFDSVAVIDGPPWGSSVPVPWNFGTDVGDTGLAGSASWAAGTFTMTGAGGDIWGTTDAFHFVYQTWYCGCPGIPPGQYPVDHVQVTARVTSVGNTNSFAKAGVMIRSTNSFNGAPAPDAAHVILDLRPTGELEFMKRSTDGGATEYVAGATVSGPVWLRLVRADAVVTGYMSSDGETWTVVGRTTVALSDDSVLAGMVVTSHDRAALNASTFDHAEVRSPQ